VPENIETKSLSPLPDLEVIHQDLKGVDKFEKDSVHENPHPSDIAIGEEVSKHIKKEETVFETENDIGDKKKSRKKKKNTTAKETTEETQVERKILICDEQIDIYQSTPKSIPLECISRLQGAKDPMNNIQDMLVVSELGQGINRGFMGLGRLYQGKYIPPERKDVTSDNKQTEEDIIEEKPEELSSNDIDLD